MSEVVIEPIGYYNKVHGFLHDEFDKDCYCQGGCSMEAVYTESQVKKLTGEKTVEKLQEQLHAQLTIPKSIADELDKRWETQNKYLQRKIAVPRDALYNAVNPYDNQLAATKIGKWIDENQNICFAYLAGKSLGVELVKVVEG
ncbi:hypothetical protein [Lactococcus cremoris]|uniref:hypothetical protein n=1 Tax=Lactococcus lactis subsp. cremoris TaxID=1359 RepID=UPI0003AB8512|nr:hypothetical protein [Lactococcus cremoris]AGV73769.1 phage-related protein [Lactococcus cremoris subsp. cremoris KW2]